MISAQDLIPELSAEEYAALKADIATRGILVPVELDEAGEPLDGRHRLRAWNELRAEGNKKIGDYQVSRRLGLTEDEKLEHALTINLSRRQLASDQKKDIARKLREVPWTLERIASVLAVHVDTVRGWTQNSTFGIPKVEFPEVPKAIGKDGKPRPITYKPRRPKTVFSKTRREDAKVQAAIDTFGEEAAKKVAGITDAAHFTKRARDEQKKRDKQKPIVVVPLPDGLDIRLGDFKEELDDLPNSSVDLVLTDPPYLEEYLEDWQHLSEQAARLLKPGGLLVSYAAPFHLPAYLSALSSHLDYVWTMAVVHQSASTQLRKYHINAGWKPILIFAKGAYVAGEWWTDLLREQKREKDEHEWQQNLEEAKTLIRYFTKPGDLVVDPFVGGGTNAVAARDLGRRFIGCEIELAAFEKARKRVA